MTDCDLLHRAWSRLESRSEALPLHRQLPVWTLLAEQDEPFAARAALSIFSSTRVLESLQKVVEQEAMSYSDQDSSVRIIKLLKSFQERIASIGFSEIGARISRESNDQHVRERRASSWDPICAETCECKGWYVCSLSLSQSLPTFYVCASLCTCICEDGVHVLLNLKLLLCMYMYLILSGHAMHM
jgi:hypothetical protein